VSDKTYIYARHAIQRMAERDITRADVESVVETGEVIRDYPDDTPYPSRLILGWKEKRPLHVVAADDDTASETTIITVYEPDPDIWNEDFRSKKS
jgi:hypothetical protein